MSFIKNLIYNPHGEPYPVSRFIVFVNNIKLGFSKVTDIEETIETEALQEGGVNNYVYSLLKPVTSERTMVLERGASSRGALMALLTMRMNTVGQRMSSDIVILVTDRSGVIKKIFLVHGARVKKIAYSDLDAMSGDVMIERFEFAYETLEQCPITSMLVGGIMGAAGVSAFDLPI